MVFPLFAFADFPPGPLSPGLIYITGINPSTADTSVTVTCTLEGIVAWDTWCVYNVTFHVYAVQFSNYVDMFIDGTYVDGATITQTAAGTSGCGSANPFEYTWSYTDSTHIAGLSNGQHTLVASKNTGGSGTQPITAIEWLNVSHCTPDCTGQTCGDDGCGNPNGWGTCSGTTPTCNSSGQCVPTNICGGGGGSATACLANSGGVNGTACTSNAICGGCSVASDCNDSNSCTTDACTVSTGLCTHTNTCGAVSGTCTINPNPALVGSNVVFNSSPSGGISPYTCDWSGPVSGINGTGITCSPSYIPGSGGPWTTEVVTVHDSNGSSYTPPACPSYTVQDFSVSAAPTTLPLVKGGASGQFTVTAHSVNGFTGTVTFSYSAPASLPAGFTGVWTSGLNSCIVPANGTCSKTFDVAAPSFGPGNVVFTFKGTYNGTITRTAPNVTASVTTGACTPVCSGKCGGSDGCSGTCPNTCTAGNFCNTSFVCVPTNICSGKACVVNSSGVSGITCATPGTSNPTCGGCSINSDCDDGNACTTDTCTVSTGLCSYSGTCRLFPSIVP